MAYIKVLKAHATLVIHWSLSLDMYDDLDSLIVVIPLQHSDEVVFRYTKGFKNRQETISFKSFWTLPNMLKVKFCLVLQYQLWVGRHQEPGTSEVARITPLHVKGTFVPHLKEKKKIILTEYVFGFPKDWSSKQRLSSPLLFSLPLGQHWQRGGITIRGTRASPRVTRHYKSSAKLFHLSETHSPVYLNQ